VLNVSAYQKHELFQVKKSLMLGISYKEVGRPGRAKDLRKEEGRGGEALTVRLEAIKNPH
jgi:hypothetical protein